MQIDQQKIQLRRYQTDDIAFLLELYASSRAAELAQFPFDQEQKFAFVQQQFSAQLHHYTTYYNTEKFFIVELGQIPAGRFFIDEWTSEYRVVDICLLPSHQNKRIGTCLFNSLFEAARNKNKAVSIHVEQHNPARLWYEKLGFNYKSHTNEVYILMEWTPSSDFGFTEDNLVLNSTFRADK
jgi:ribosomal protein S18 acetylase RimI-like enzyme